MIRVESSEIMQNTLVRAHCHLPIEKLFILLPFQKLYFCKGCLSTVQASLLCKFFCVLQTVATRKGLQIVLIQPHQLFSAWSPYYRFQLSFKLRMRNSDVLSSPSKFCSCISFIFRQCDGVASRTRAWLSRAVLVQLQRSYQHSLLTPTSALQHRLGAHTYWQSLLWTGWIHTGKTQLMVGAKPLLCVWLDDLMFCICRQSVCLVRFAGSSRTELKEWRFIRPLSGTCRRMLPCLLCLKTWLTWTRTVLR